MGASKVTIADLSAINARALVGAEGSDFATPAGGLVRISSIMANATGPGSLNTSPASRFGVITESAPLLPKVASSKWLIDEPDS